MFMLNVCVLPEFPLCTSMQITTIKIIKQIQFYLLFYCAEVLMKKGKIS